MNEKSVLTVIVTIVLTSVLMPSVFSYNSCLSNGTVTYFNSTNATSVLNDLSAICDSQNAISGNLTSLSINVISLINQNQNLTSTISNISSYISSSAINTQIANTTQSYLANFTTNLITLQNISNSFIKLTEAVHSISNVSAFENDVNTKFSEFGHNFVTEAEFQSTINSLKQNATQPVIQPRNDYNGIYFAVFFIVSLVAVLYVYLKFIQKKETPHHAKPEPFTADEEKKGAITRAVLEHDMEHIEDHAIERVNRDIERKKKTKEILEKKKKSDSER